VAGFGDGAAKSSLRPLNLTPAPTLCVSLHPAPLDNFRDAPRATDAGDVAAMFSLGILLKGLCELR
jgi:hypothetical protein